MTTKELYQKANYLLRQVAQAKGRVQRRYRKELEAVFSQIEANNGAYS